MEENEWAVMSYTLPREPSRIRVSIWRKLKKIGAVNIQPSMWILPLSDANLRLFEEVRNEINLNLGEAFIMKSSADENGRKSIIERFNTARDEEYQELYEECERFIKDLDKEAERQNFSFAEIEENEEELLKLRQWYEKIRARDTFEASLGEQSKSLLTKCSEALETFCDKVYAFTNKEG